MYIKNIGFSFAVCKYGKVIREFATYEEAVEYVKGIKGE